MNTPLATSTAGAGSAAPAAPLSPVFLRQAFRPFFFAGLIYSIFSMALWTWQYRFGWPSSFSVVSLNQWHAHEMVFGYSLAVVSGFLLTAVQNWTQQRAVYGTPLLILFILWVIPRVGSVALTDWALWLGLVCSAAFYPFLLYHFRDPLLKASRGQARGNHQWGLQGKIVSLWAVETLFLLAALGYLNPAWISPLLLLGLYLIISLILMLAQRVTPFFIENALGRAGIEVSIPRPLWLNIAMLILFFTFIISDFLLLAPVSPAAGLIAVSWISGLALAAVGVASLILRRRGDVWVQPPWLNLVMLVLLSVFLISVVLSYAALPPFSGLGWLTLLSGLALGACGIAKLTLWHHPAIWSHPLLWVLFVGYSFTVFGLLMRAVTPALDLFPYLSLHLLSYGGIGIMTLGMIARTGLGHTGRRVDEPPPIIVPAFIALVVGAVIRSLAPIVWMGAYPALVMISQLLWIAGFAIILSAYARPMLTPRVDGKDG